MQRHMKKAGNKHSGETTSDNKTHHTFAKVQWKTMRAPRQHLKPSQRRGFVSCWGDAYRRAVEPLPASGLGSRKSPQEDGGEGFRSQR